MGEFVLTLIVGKFCLHIGERLCVLSDTKLCVTEGRWFFYKGDGIFLSYFCEIIYPQEKRIGEERYITLYPSEKDITFYLFFKICHILSNFNRDGGKKDERRKICCFGYK